jgi:hypothetical protein
MLKIFEFPLPPTVNAILKSCLKDPCAWSETKKDWTKKIKAIALEQSSYQFEGRVWVEFFWIVQNFNRDPDNLSGASKFIFDGLVNAKLIKDDSLMIVQSPVIHHYLSGDDGIVLVVSEMPIPETTRKEVIDKKLNLVCC